MIITRYSNGHNDFYMENPRTIMEIKKPQGLRLLIKIHYTRSSYRNLPSRFILKAYPPIPTTSSTYMIQKSLIAPLNTL